MARSLFSVKSPKRLLLFILILLLIATAVALLVADRLDEEYRETYEIPGYALMDGAKDFDIKHGVFTSKSNDSWLEIVVPRGRYNGVLLDVSYLSKPSTTYAVYYCSSEDEEYSETRCYTKELTQGYVFVELYGQTIGKVRLDLTDEKNVSIALNQVLFYPTNVRLFTRILIIIISGFLLALLLFAAISIREKRKNSSETTDGDANRRLGRLGNWREALGLYRLTTVEKYYLFFCFIVYAFWMLTFVGLHYAPDEYMRYNIPKFIYANNALPKGWEESLRDPSWGFSYGFDIALPYLISAFFMKIASLFSQSDYVLLMAARLTSLLSMIGVGYFSILFSKKVFGANPLRWMYIVLMTLLPLFVFLASYVNLDSFSLFTVTMIIYSWVICLEKKWSIPSTAMLAVALGLCFMSYKFAYSYILMTMLLYFAWHLLNHKQTSFKSFMLKGLLIVGIVFVICGWKFIRNALLYDGDFLSLNVSNKYGELYAAEGFKPSERQSLTLKAQGYGPRYMLVETPWLSRTFRSFIGVFGYSDVFMPDWIYRAYRLIIIIGGIGAIFWTIRLVVRRRRCEGFRDTVLIMAGMLFASMITVAISLYFSWTGDYQAQGRYIIAGAPMLFMCVTLGMDFWISALCRISLFEKIGRQRLQILCSAAIGAFVILSLIQGTATCLQKFGYPGQSFPWVLTIVQL